MNTMIVAAMLIIGLGTFSAQCPAADFGPNNPFFSPSTLPFQAPPFDKIKDEDYQPAMEAGMARGTEGSGGDREQPGAPNVR